MLKLKNGRYRQLAARLFLSLATVLALAETGFGQSHDQDAVNKGFTDLTQSGNLFNIAVEPVGRDIRLQVVGKDAVKVKIEDTKIEATYGLGSSRRKLTLVKKTEPGSGKVVYTLSRDQEAALENVELNIQSGSNQEKFSIPKIP